MTVSMVYEYCFFDNGVKKQLEKEELFNLGIKT